MISESSLRLSHHDHHWHDDDSDREALHDADSESVPGGFRVKSRDGSSRPRAAASALPVTRSSESVRVTARVTVTVAAAVPALAATWQPQ